MKCPYCPVIQDVTQQKYEYDDDDENLSIVTIISNQTPTFLDCLKEECAAFRDGQCHYKE